MSRYFCLSRTSSSNKKNKDGIRTAIFLMMASLCTCSAFITTTRTRTIMQTRGPMVGMMNRFQQHTTKNLSSTTSSSFMMIGKRHKRFLRKRQGIGLYSSKVMTMWGESNSPKSVPTTWYDNESDSTRNYSQRSQRPYKNDTNDDDERRFFRERNDNMSNNNGGSGWDDFASDSADSGTSLEPYEYQRKSNTRNNRDGGGDRGRSSRRQYRNNSRNENYSSNTKDQRSFKRKDTRDRKLINAEIAERKVNMRALEKAGFDHLYGIAPVLNAFAMEKRDFEADEEAASTGRKPEAQFTPYLFVQDTYAQDDSSSYTKGGRSGGGRSDDKMKAAKEILRLVEETEVPIAYVDKGALNALSNNRPHQGFVLRCRSLEFTPMYKIPFPNDEHDNDSQPTPKLWLVLDEVVDPQNFGALLRSAYFLGSSSSVSSNIGVMVCAKNSSPATSSVSAASAGALELMTIYSTANLPRTLNTAVEDGWRVLGAASEALTISRNNDDPDNDGIIPCTDLMNLELRKDEPTILVLGSEGHGLRTLVARSCTEFVRIPSAASADQYDDDDSVVGVDSLNVSVTAGILLWSLVNGVLK